LIISSGIYLYGYLFKWNLSPKQTEAFGLFIRLVDDFCDVEQDIEEGRYNYFIHKGEKDAFAKLMEFKREHLSDVPPQYVSNLVLFYSHLYKASQLHALLDGWEMI